MNININDIFRELNNELERIGDSGYELILEDQSITYKLVYELDKKYIKKELGYSKHKLNQFIITEAAHDFVDDHFHFVFDEVDNLLKTMYSQNNRPMITWNIGDTYSNQTKTCFYIDFMIKIGNYNFCEYEVFQIADMLYKHKNLITQIFKRKIDG